MSGARDRGHALLQAGVALFLAGLLVGLAVPAMANPRMGLASHLEGVMNGHGVPPGPGRIAAAAAVPPGNRRVLIER